MCNLELLYFQLLCGMWKNNGWVECYLPLYSSTPYANTRAQVLHRETVKKDTALHSIIYFSTPSSTKEKAAETQSDTATTFLDGWPRSFLFMWTTTVEKPERCRQTSQNSSVKFHLRGWSLTEASMFTQAAADLQEVAATCLWPTSLGGELVCVLRFLRMACPSLHLEIRWWLDWWGRRFGPSKSVAT